MTIGADSKRAVTIEIAGAKYRLTSDADPAHIERLAQRVNARVQELGPKARRAASPAQLLAVVALSLAEDLESAEREHEGLEERIHKALHTAIARIDSRLAAGARV